MGRKINYGTHPWAGKGFKRPKKIQVFKKFPVFKGNKLKVSLGILLDFFFNEETISSSLYGSKI